jgi:glutaredoxin
MKIEILTTPACSNCKIVEKIFDDIGVSYNIIDITENPEYLEKYPTFTAPGIVINDKLEFTGIPSKKELINKLSQN